MPRWEVVHHREPGSSPTAWTGIADSGPGGQNRSSFTVTGLANGVTYDLQVRAVNAAGPGASISVSSTPSTVPGPPRNLSATSGNGQVTLTWDPPGFDGGASITGYLYATTGGASFHDIPASAAGQANSGSYTLSGLKNGRELTITLYARNAMGMSTGSNSVAVTPVAPLPTTPGTDGPESTPVPTSVPTPTPVPTPQPAPTAQEILDLYSQDPERAIQQRWGSHPFRPSWPPLLRRSPHCPRLFRRSLARRRRSRPVSNRPRRPRAHLR